ncbi:MAG: M23 family metallopeptidase [Bacteroidetes bacterium]|nr:M23 family metallopeptidase [Bacteroidota bacterium]
MKRTCCLLGYLLCMTFSANAQKLIPTNYFSSPLGIDLSVTGAFGEIRPNHLHSGADFQVQKKEGLPVYAVADGFVSRIKISPVGFGNALYIDHPNGFTSVYGHLYNYNDSIASYARIKQYEKKSFEVDLFPAHDHDTIWVRQGEPIAFAGNSGSSFGAHLHFELRNTETERIINPLLFGLKTKDNYSPYIDFITVYPESAESFADGSNKPLKFNVSKVLGGEYRLKGNDTIDVFGEFGIGVQAFDYLYNDSDRNGWYSLKMLLDKAPFFSMQLDSFAFSETRFINASLDYSDSYWNGTRIVQSVKLPGDELSLHNSGSGNGKISIKDDHYHELVVIVGDLSGKQAVLRCTLHGRKPVSKVEVPDPESPDTVVVFSYLKDNNFNTSDLALQFPKGTLFDDLGFQYSRMPIRKGYYSARHCLHVPYVPLKGKMLVSIKADKLPPRLRSMALLARIDQQGHLSTAGGSYSDGYVKAETNLFDSYAIVVDSVPPKIKPIRDRNKHHRNIKFNVSDNLSGIDKYYAEINHKWALVEWDPKNDLMVYNYDQLVRKGKNTFKLTLIDKKGNKSSYSTLIRQ